MFFCCFFCLFFLFFFFFFFLVCFFFFVVFFTDVYRITIYGLVKMSVMPIVYLLDNIFIRFGAKHYRQPTGIPMELTVLLLLQICFSFVMKEISGSLSHGKIKLTLPRLSSPLQDTLDAHADLSLRWSHKSYCRFCRALPQFTFRILNKKTKKQCLFK